MAVCTISTKGQITLPAKLRKKLGMKAHDRVIVEATDDAIVVKRIRDFFELKGFLGKAFPASEEREGMMRAVAAHVEGRD